MARYSGMIGFSETVETAPGCWEPGIVEKKYRGYITVNNWRRDAGEKVNDDLSISNRISIIASPYAYAHIANIAYVEWAGAKWKVTGIEVNRPRLILTLGGLWNDGQETETPS